MAAKLCLVKVATYLQKWCPIDDELLVNAECWILTTENRKPLQQLSIFISNFSNLFGGFDLYILAEQFMAYQVLPDDAIPLIVKINISTP